MLAEKIRVTNIQHLCVNDGPGVRTTVFLKGCTLRCPWCCNPETISAKDEYFLDDNKCLYLSGISSKLCYGCERCGGKKKIINCPFGVAKTAFVDYTIGQLYAILSKDFNLIQSANGGVTFSGGEPLLQITAMRPLLEKLKENGIHLAFETTLTTSDESVVLALTYANTMIVDMKLQPEHPLYRNQQYFDNLKRRISMCRNSGVEIIFRLVFVESLMLVRDAVFESLNMLGVCNVELLNCHNLGQNKYKKLNIENKDYTANYHSLLKFAETLNAYGIHSRTLTV